MPLFISTEYLNKVILDISAKNPSTMNIILIDELVIDNCMFTEDGENSMEKGLNFQDLMSFCQMHFPFDK